MNCRSIRLCSLRCVLLAFPFRSPAPLIYRPGEGWTYEPVGGEGKWQQPRAKDQLEVAQAAFDKKEYGLALKAARRVMQVWPLSDYAPQAQYLIARCYEAEGEAEKAFKEYQKLLEKQPKLANFEEILQRQFDIANLYLAGKWFKLWGYIPFRSMERTAKMYRRHRQDRAVQRRRPAGAVEHRHGPGEAKDPRLQDPRLFRRRQGL